MIQAYSNNLTVPANTPVPFNNVKIRKGCTAVLSGASTFELNKRGVYYISVDAYGEAAEAGDISLQLFRNGVSQPDAISQATGAVGEIDTLHFSTFVQVEQDNTPCCCTGPVNLQIVTGDTDITGMHINTVITKIC